MSGSVNKVILIGRLGRDPESRSFQNGGKVVNLRIATSETWRDKASGERKERTEWHSVAIHNEALARVAEQYLRKGSQVYIEGQLETRKWQDQSGADKYSTEIVLRAYGGALTLLDGRKDADDEYPPQDDAGRKPQSRHNALGGAQAGGYGGGMPGGLDDDLPF